MLNITLFCVFVVTLRGWGQTVFTEQGPDIVNLALFHGSLIPSLISNCESKVEILHAASKHFGYH